jgi:hypothetical protein
MNEQKRWDIEHLSDDDYATKYQPSGAAIVWGFVMAGLVVCGTVVWLIAR